MRDENTPDPVDRDEDLDQEREVKPRRGSGYLGLTQLMRSARQTAAWFNTYDEQIAPLRAMEATRRSITDAMGPHNAAYQAALDARRRSQAVTAPILALRSSISDTYDWHRRINDVARSVSLPRKLLDQLAAAAALFLPANLSGLDTTDISAILEMSEDDGLSLAWAPRTDIVKALLPLDTRQARYALLLERRMDVLADVDDSLKIVTHPELTGMVTLLSAAISTGRGGHDEAAQALAGNVLDTAMKRHGNAWIRRSFPQVEYPKDSHHGTISSALDNTDDWGALTLLQFTPYLVLAGMRNTFGPGATQETFNRHLGAHEASPDTYRQEFVLPAILLAHALLRALNQNLEHPDDEENDA